MSFEEKLYTLIEKAGAKDVGVAAYRLGSGEEILIRPDTPFHPASTIKICIMMEVFHQANLGLFSINGSLPIKNEFTSIADGSAYSLSSADDSDKELYKFIGQSIPIRDLLRLMITVSSNLATNLLVTLVTPERTTEFMRELGGESLIVLRGVEDNKAFQLGLNNSATPRGFMKILLKLARREVVSPEDSNDMIAILGQQQFNQMIPAQLPASVKVAHKTGWTGDVYHDIGIVYPRGGSEFVLAILTRGFQKEETAYTFVASLANSIYRHWLQKYPD